MSEQILFDRLAYIDRLKRAGIADDQARAHAEAMDEALREAVATKRDVAAVSADMKTEFTAVRASIELLRRDMIITTGTAATALFVALAAIKFFS